MTIPISPVPIPAELPLTALFFPVNNDVVVTAQFPQITDGTGMTSNFWYKDSKTIPDTDPTSVSYPSDIIQNEVGVWFAQFSIPAANNAIAGAFWWRVDAIDVENKCRTAACGTLLVEAV
jgi:hypothetical protein